MLKRISLLLPLVVAAQSTTNKPLEGFRPDAARQEVDLEARYDRTLNRQSLDAWMKRMTAEPHHVGSPGSKKVADFIADQFKSWGYDTKIETFYPLFPTPKTRLVEMIAPQRMTATIEEATLAEDATSGIRSGLPVYHAYSTDGDVTGDVVYVNYGVPDDYKK